MRTAALTETDAWRALHEVKDPEIPVIDVVEMGIVRDVRVDDDTVTVDFTPTFSGCPALEVMRREIRASLKDLGFAHVAVNTVLYPPWTTRWLTAEAKQKLQRFGIAPPGKTGSLIDLETAPPRCPRCRSFDTRMTSTFGSTLCKSIHVCNACLEPFEGFKSV